MFLIILAVACALIATISAIFMKTYKTIIPFTVGIVLCIVCVLASVALFTSSNQIATNLVEENYELNLYYGPVNSSFNEYVRYDFYEKAETHDAAIDSYMKNANTFILKDFYKVEKLGGIHKINFSLRADEPRLAG